ncbi:MAG: hypothetical protein LAO08_05245 [Acidobacteriia bacterium]|nr:hypothetical protein [Terriglobia bacterium]
MAKPGKSELEKVLKLIVDSAEKRLSHLPPKDAAAVRKKIRRIASATASLGRVKAPKPARTHARAASRRSRTRIA